jgi:hypothetical protein
VEVGQEVSNVAARAKPHGARLYFFDDGVILIKQTVMKGSGRYIIDADDNGGH